MAQRGRKSQKDELGILRRYADLTEPYFKVLKTKLESKTDPAAQMWAVEQLTKAFVKMIPQDVDMTSKGKELKPAVIKIVAPDGTDIQTLTKAVSGMAIPDGQDND